MNLWMKVLSLMLCLAMLVGMLAACQEDTVDGELTESTEASLDELKKPNDKDSSDGETEHGLGDWTVVREASCEEDGLRQRSCPHCSEIESEGIPATGHSYKDKLCTNCGDIQEIPTDGLKYYSNGDGTCMVTGMSDNCTDTVVVIPSISPAGDIVVAIQARSFSNKFKVTDFVIPDTVTSIGEDAFEGTAYYSNQSNWENGLLYIGDCLVEVRSGLTDTCIVKDGTRLIPDMAFYANSSIKEFLLPDSIRNIGFQAFYRTGYYNNQSNWEDGVLYIGKHLISGNPSGDYTVKDGTLTIARSAFMQSKMTGITIPDSVVTVHISALSNCDELTHITFGENNANHRSVDGVWYTKDGTRLILYPKNKADTSFTVYEGTQTIGQIAMKDVKNLKELTIPNTVQWIENQAFSGCKSLEHVVLPDGLTSLGGGAFSRCYQLAEIVIPSGITVIYGSTFMECTSLTSVTLPEGLTEIGKNVFWDCKSLTGIVIPAGVTVIDEHVFRGCTSLKSVTMPERLKTIKSYAFHSCSSLEILEVPATVTEIGEAAFSLCSKLRSVTLPAELTAIEKQLFYACSELSEITIPERVTSIGPSAFYGCSSLTSVVIPVRLTVSDTDAFADCDGLTGIYISDLSAWLAIRFSNPNANPLSYANHLYLNGELLTELRIPDGTTHVLANSFSGCTSLTSVFFPQELTSIGAGAFNGCIGVKSFELPQGVTSMGSGAFSGCTGLESFVIPQGVTDISSYLFNGCTGLNQIVIPEGVTSIGGNSFDGCIGLESITIPKTVEHIYSEAFNDCTALKNVYISDLKAWCKIKLDSSDANPLCYAENFYLNGELLTELTTPNGISEIERWTFFGWTGLERVTFSEFVKKIDTSAFNGCTNLKSIVILSTKFSISNNSFRNCTSLTDVYYADTQQKWSLVSGRNYLPATATIHFNYVPENS